MVAVSDVRGGIFRADGLDPAEIVAHVKQTGSVVDLPGTAPLDGDALLSVDCDVLVPAALGEVIHEGNWESIQASIIVEGANHPVTPYADYHLEKQGTVVVPDIVANAGGVVVSYFEWTQNIQQHRWPLEQVDRELEQTLCNAHNAVQKRAHDEGISLRTSAFMTGVKRVVEALELRGMVPANGVYREDD